MKIYCFGDSNTFGFDPRSYFGERYPDNVRWTGLLGAMGWETVNRGMNGREIPVSSYELDMTRLELREQTDSDILLIMLGGNDLLNHPDISAGETAEKMKRFLTCLAPKGRTVLIVPPKMAPGSWTADVPDIIEKSMQLSRTYEKISRELPVDYLDTSDIEFPLCSDGVHLLPEGHRMMAEAVDRFLRKEVKQNR